MSVMATVENGKVLNQTVEAATNSTKTREASNTMDKQAFLQLLVAQMQYQDPLEPTDNTEYVAQLATFSELEAMNNLNESMSISRASELVGKYVSVQKTSSTTGESTETEGLVDYVMVENNKAYLVIDGEPYSIDDLKSVMTDAYWNAYQELLKNQETSATAEQIMAAIAALPENASDITLDKTETVDLVSAIRKSYDALTSDDKKFVTNDALVRLIQAEHQIAKLQAEKAREEAASGEQKDAGDAGTQAQETNATA